MLRFSVDEVYEMAQAQERCGIEFYRRAAELVPDEPLSNLLLSLAGMEEGHLRTFTDLREHLPEEDRRRDDPVLPEDAEEHRHYIRTLVRSHVFGSADEAWFSASVRKSRADVLTRAAALEKDSIVFLLELQELVPAPRGQKEIAHILREELQHLRMLHAMVQAE
ncbi:MAG TPA: hypothetical protein PLP01_00155 [Phycisphaerae bacterium]|nr:hypothetical protein [Phycisphaerae bacterium]